MYIQTLHLFTEQKNDIKKKKKICHYYIHVKGGLAEHKLQNKLIKKNY